MNQVKAKVSKRKKAKGERIRIIAKPFSRRHPISCWEICYILLMTSWISSCVRRLEFVMGDNGMCQRCLNTLFAGKITVWSVVLGILTVLVLSNVSSDIWSLTVLEFKWFWSMLFCLKIDIKFVYFLLKSANLSLNFGFARLIEF